MELFQKLSSYSYIIVTGTQRSGTHFVTDVIEHELDMPKFYEPVVGYGHGPTGNKKEIDELKGQHARFVLQLPGACHVCHLLADDKTAIVLVRRPIAEIVASQEARGWTDSWSGRCELGKYGLSSGVISEIKYKSGILSRSI
jgi:hypothetical protein